MMEFSVEFYESTAGRCPVREFLDELKASDPDDFAAIVAGLAKLRNRQYHQPPLSKPVGNGLFELRHVGKLNTRVLYFFTKGRRIVGGAWHPQQGQGNRSARPGGGAGADERLARKAGHMKKTNFDLYLEEQLKDKDFAERFRQAGEAWKVALQITKLREEAGLSQKELAKRLGTTQQQISRLESPSYEGHSLSMLRRVAAALNADIRVVIERTANRPTAVAESRAKYKTRR